MGEYISDEALLKEIAAGESKTLEFKATLPAKSEKYVKTLIAFANSAGGKLIVGVKDNCEIVGVSNAAQVVDSIASALSDTCKPLLTPRIEEGY